MALATAMYANGSPPVSEFDTHLWRPNRLSAKSPVLLMALEAVIEG